MKINIVFMVGIACLCNFSNAQDSFPPVISVNEATYETAALPSEGVVSPSDKSMFGFVQQQLQMPKSGSPSVPVPRPIFTQQQPQIIPQAIPQNLVPQNSVPQVMAPPITTPQMIAPQITPTPSQDIYQQPFLQDSECTNCGGNCLGSCEPLSIGGCNSCGGGSCMGSCFPTPRYLIVDALYFDREASITPASSGFALSPFDYELGARITIGTRFDGEYGTELTFVGPFQWNDSIRSNSAAGALNTLFTPGAGLNAGNFTAFNNANFHQQTQDSSLNSIELNKTFWGWDVISFSAGMRYVRFEDDFQFLSNSAGQAGRYSLNINNQLIGAQVGTELFYDIGARTSLSVRAKLGGFANYHNGGATLVNNGATVLFTSDDDTDFSGLFELGGTAHWEIGDCFRFRAGYEMWVISDLATTQENVTPVVAQTTGTNLRNDEDLLFHGLSLGLEIFW